MTSCERMLPLIVRAADGALSVAERAALDEHLFSCAGCREALSGQTAVSRALAEMPFDAAPPGFAARVRARIEARPGVIDLFNWRAWTLRLAPVAALVGLLAWLPSSQTTWTLTAAEEAWASGDIFTLTGAPQSGAIPGAILFDTDVDGYDLVAAALEVQPQ